MNMDDDEKILDLVRENFFLPLKKNIQEAFEEMSHLRAIVKNAAANLHSVEEKFELKLGKLSQGQASIWTDLYCLKKELADLKYDVDNGRNSLEEIVKKTIPFHGQDLFQINHYENQKYITVRIIGRKIGIHIEYETEQDFKDIGHFLGLLKDEF